MTVHSFKEGDRVRLTTEGRSKVSERLREDPEVPVYALNPGVVVDMSNTIAADLVLKALFDYLGIDLFVHPDGSSESAANPLAVHSDEYESEA